MTVVEGFLAGFVMLSRKFLMVAGPVCVMLYSLRAVACTNIQPDSHFTDAYSCGPTCSSKVSSSHNAETSSREQFERITENPLSSLEKKWSLFCQYFPIDSLEILLEESRQLLCSLGNANQSDEELLDRLWSHMQYTVAELTYSDTNEFIKEIQNCLDLIK